MTRETKRPKQSEAREQISVLIAEGYSDEKIASSLGLTSEDIKAHRAKLMERLADAASHLPVAKRRLQVRAVGIDPDALRLALVADPTLLARAIGDDTGLLANVIKALPKLSNRPRTPAFEKLLVQVVFEQLKKAEPNQKNLYYIRRTAELLSSRTLLGSRTSKLPISESQVTAILYPKKK